jgi:hypothetical protein
VVHVTTAEAIQAAVVFTWLGMVLGISFLEAPLKFRAPGITIPLGVGIGRLVFRALNIIEAAFAVVLIGTLVAQGSDARTLTVVLVILLTGILAIGAGVLRPRMDRRYAGGQVSESMPRNNLHVGYIALECLKVVLLLVLGIATLAN